MVRKKRINYLYEGGTEKSIPRDHRVSSRVMPNGDPRDVFFDPTLPLLILITLFCGPKEHLI